MTHTISDGSIPALHIQMLGGFRVTAGSRIILEREWHLRKAKNIVKLLALAPDHRLPREQVLDVLWPDLDFDAAANNLHRTLFTARHILEPTLTSSIASSYLALRDDILILCPSASVRVDVDAFLEAYTSARRTGDLGAYESALALYTGEVLPDDRYEDWAAGPREEMRRRYTTLLADMARLYALHHDHTAAIAALERLVAAEPTREDAHVGLMRLYALCGQRYRALRQYQQLRDVLRRDLETDPDVDTRRLYQAIRDGRFPVRAAQAPALAPRTASLPYGASSDAEQRSPSAPEAGAPAADAQPALDRSAASRANLPQPLTNFIGRRQEMSIIEQLLQTSRLLTLTGAGGCGKTRLALQVATHLLAHYADGIFWIDLSALADPVLVPQAVASALKLREESGQPLTDTLLGFLRTKCALLVLDNCEHLVQACAELATLLLGQCASLRILATSRQVLGVIGETSWRVPSLATSDPEHLPPLEEVRSYDAIQLFLDRARTSRPGFTLTQQNAAAIIRICHRLDGIPLAIELAAVWVSILAVGEIATRLENCLDLLRRGSRGGLPRHQTLRATLDWSHALLSEQERVVFRRLAVFAGGWTPSAVERVCAGDGIEAEDVLPLLAQLVDKSLVVVEELPGQGEEVRHRFLEPIRQYALEKLHATGEFASLHERHAQWCLAFAEAAAPHLTQPEQAEWRDRLEQEHDNLRAALRWMAESGQLMSGLRLSGKLWRFWWTHGHLSEGLGWLENLLSQCQVAASAAQEEAAEVLLGAGWLSHLVGDNARAIAHSEEALALFRRRDDQLGMAHALRNLALVAHYEGRYEQSAQLYEEALALLRIAGDKHSVCLTVNNMGTLAQDQGDYARAAALYGEALEMSRELGDKRTYAGMLGNLGELAYIQGDFSHATTLCEEALARNRALGDPLNVSDSLHTLGMVALSQADLLLASDRLNETLAIDRALGNKWGIALVLNGLGLCAYYQGNSERAIALCTESLDLHRDLSYKQGAGDALLSLGRIALGRNDLHRADLYLREALDLFEQLQSRRGIATCLECVAGASIAHGAMERAARLLGCAEALREAISVALPPLYQPEYGSWMQRLRSTLPSDTLAEAWGAGRRLQLMEALAEAHGESITIRQPVEASAGLDSKLSQREREVARLIMFGHTNRQIAEALAISERTVDAHVRSILSKLGLTSRAQVMIHIG